MKSQIFVQINDQPEQFHKDSKVGKELIPIGKILDDPDELLKANSGDTVSLYCATG